MSDLRPVWLKRTARGLVVLVGLVLILLLAGSTALWFTVQDRLKTADFAPAKPLSSYADEAAPAPRPAPAPAPFDWAAIDAPPTSALPWVRWWWPGGNVEPSELRHELDQLKAANFGGAEVQPFAFGVKAVTDKDPAARARIAAFDTPAYFAILRGVMKDAADRGLRIDLTHYSGWPAGSPAVGVADGLQSLAWSERRFRGGRQVEIALPRPKPSLNALLLAASSLISPMGDISDFDPSRAQLLSVLVARPKGGGHSLFSTKDTLRLDAASVQVVDAQVKDGKLVWDAPPGRWVLVASWILPAGQPPMFSAPEPPGYAVDVLRAANVRAHYNYAFGRRTGLDAEAGHAFRGIFNDSLEFAVDRLGSADILAEFRRRRGYDLRPHLPVVFVDAADSFYVSELLPSRKPNFTLGEMDDRIRHDYQLTLSDLVVERFLDETRTWAAARGLKSRGQGYGMDIDVLRALGANDIPETEQLYAGGGEAFLRMAGSAAALYGRDLVSAEAFVWADQDYATTPAKLKAAADKLFLSGVNHVIYHGFPYDWRAGDRDRWFGDQGWAPFASDPMAVFSDNYSPRNPLWADLPALNAYIGRSQNLLRQGRQAADVLIYYPFLGYRATGYGPDELKEPLFLGAFPSAAPAGPPPRTGVQGTDERILWLRKMAPVFDALNRRGLTWGWVNGDGLRNQLLPDGRMRSGASYGAILLAEVEAMAPEDLAAVQALAAHKVPVALYGRTPVRQPGYLDANVGDARVRASSAALAAAASSARTPAALVDAIVAASRPDLRFAGRSALQRYSRILANGGRIDFLANPGASEASTLISTQDHAQAWWFDARTGRAAPAVRDAEGRIGLTLQAYDSRFLIRGVPMPAHLASPAMTTSPVTRAWPLKGWSLRVGGDVRTSGLFDWRSDEALRHSRAEGVYSAKVTLPELAPGARRGLRLGIVPGMATVRINGRDAGRASLPPGELDVSGLLKPGVNRIEIVYRPTLRNWMIGRAAEGDKRAAAFRSRTEALTPAGLQQPISIVEHGAPDARGRTK